MLLIILFLKFEIERLLLRIFISAIQLDNGESSGIIIHIVTMETSNYATSPKLNSIEGQGLIILTQFTHCYCYATGTRAFRPTDSTITNLP
jgi:hypothetical protein